MINLNPETIARLAAIMAKFADLAECYEQGRDIQPALNALTERAKEFGSDWCDQIAFLLRENL